MLPPDREWQLPYLAQAYRSAPELRRFTEDPGHLMNALGDYAAAIQSYVDAILFKREQKQPFDTDTLRPCLDGIATLVLWADLGHFHGDAGALTDLSARLNILFSNEIPPHCERDLDFDGEFISIVGSALNVLSRMQAVAALRYVEWIVSGNEPTGLTQAQLELWRVVKEAERRLTGREIADILAKKNIGQSEPTIRGHATTLIRLGHLTNTSRDKHSEAPRGYGLPHWP